MNADEEARLIVMLANLEERSREIRAMLCRGKAPELAASNSRPSYTSYAEAALVGRARIARHLPGELFADPALDILLDLFVAVEKGERRTIKSVTIASRVPNTTALRWIGVLVEAGLVEKGNDPADRRLVTLRLLPSAQAAVSAWLDEVSAIPLRRELAD